MARLKSLFHLNHSVPTLFNFLNRGFHSASVTTKLPSSWATMTQSQRIDLCVVEATPNLPEIAYYKALGLLEFGPEYYEDAITALTDAIHMKNGDYWIASYKLAQIYNSMGQEHTSFVILMDASKYFMKSIISTNKNKFGNLYDEWIKSFKLAEYYNNQGLEHKSFTILMDSWTKFVNSFNDENLYSSEHLTLSKT